jgi:ankyrin repeat protein
MFATLAGYELDNGSAQLAPWKVQEMVAEGLQQRTNHHNFEIASRACLELGLCHYLGFGVERDQSKVLQYFDQAAAKGCFEARRIRHRLYEAFSESMGDLDILVEVDKQEERQLQRLLEAELRSADVNPFQVFDEVAQEDFRSQMGDSELSLHQVAYIGNVARIRKLLRDGSDFQDDQGRTALFLAVQGQHLDAMRMLLELGNSDPSLPDENGHTALHMLIMLSNVDVEAGLSLMLQFSPESDLNAFSSSLLDASEHWGELWGAPLHWAVLAGNKAMTSCLVKAGARVHDWPQESCPVRIAASLHLSEILEILLSAIPPGVSLRGSNPFFALNSSNPFRRLLLHGKNYVLQIEKTISILTRKYPVIDKQEGSWNGNPLRKVLTVNFSDSDRYIAKALVEAGAFKDDYEGLTLLQSAIIGCHGSPMSSICRMALDMIEIQQDFRQRSNEHRTGWTALHWAAAGGLVPVVTMLLQVDQDSIDLRTEDEEERTPLHLAAESGKSIAMINLLLKHGADACLTTSGLRLTPLGSFVSNQRSELNVDILKALLEASKTTGYLAFSSDNWNVLHYAATRAALLDAESLPGHLLLRTLATMPEMKSLIESTTAQGWTALHLAAYLVDYTTIRLLVDEFNANVQTQNPKAATAFDIVLEIARRFPEGLRGADSVSRWSRLAYRSALYLQAKLEAIEGPYHLTPLHLAAYIGYHDEVVRLVQKEPDAVFETNWEGETPRQMLQNTMPVDVSADWAARFRTIAEKVCGVLESKELELEEESEQAWIASHQMSL